MSRKSQDIMALPEILKLKEAAVLLRIDDETLRRLSESGKIKAAFKVGGQWRYRRVELTGEQSK